MTKTKSEIIDFINEYIVSNTERRVTPEDIRIALLDIINSIHILAEDNNIEAGNIGSPPYKNTRVGEGALNSVSKGDFNTAVGYESSSCLVFGDENVSLGAYSLENNMSGNQNVAIGVGALNFLKSGDNNVAIGNFAGYYIGSGDSNQLFIGSHPIDTNFVEQNPSGDSTIVPLIRGDFDELKVAIATDEINNGGTLQVNGDTTPSLTDQFNLGSSDYVWDKLYTNEIDSNNNIKISKTIEPNGINVSIGTQDFRFKNLHVENIFVSDNAELNTVTNTTSINSYNKQIHLSTSGTNPLTNEPKAILSDEGLMGAGLYAWSIGTGQDRSYSISFSSPSFNLDYLVEDNIKSKAHWNSDISFSTSEGRHVLTDMLRGRQTLTVLNEDGNTIFLGDNIAVGQYEVVDEFKNWDYSDNFNFVSSGDYVTGLFSTESGVVLGLDMFSRYEGDQDVLNGFALRYYDYEDPFFAITSFDGYNFPQSSFVIMKDEPKMGFSYRDIDNFKPETTFNIYGSGDSIVRFSGEGTSSLQISPSGNDFTSGLEIKTDLQGALFSLNGSGNLSFYENYTSSEKPFSIKESLVDLEEFTSNENYGSLVVKESSNSSRKQDLFFVDEDGNYFDLLSPSTSDIYDFSFVFWENANTIVGATFRDNISSNNSISIGSNNILDPITFPSNVILLGNNLSSLSSIVHNGKLLVGNEHSLHIEAALPSGITPGYFKVNDEFLINNNLYDTELSINYDNNRTNFTLVTENYLDHDIIRLNHVPYGLLKDYESFSFSSDEPSVDIRGDLNIFGNINFLDGSFIDTAASIPTVPGNGIVFNYDNDLKQTVISFNVSDIQIDNEDNIFNYNSNIIIETDGEVKRSPLSQLSQFVNHTNPQFLFQCSFGYNLVLSNNTAIDHSKNCNNIFVGNQAGNDAIWLTNSVIIGPNAGAKSYISNTNLDGDVSLIAIGHNAGRRSSSSDNSIFIGPSAGQDADCSDNSVFIGNSAGQSSHSKKSIGIGDNALESVKGRNNLEIIPNKDFNRLINGSVSNKFNIAGSIMGDMCVGRVSVGGSARIFPSATFEVSAKFDDPSVSLQNWYNSNGELVAFLDQQGNLRLRGSVLSGRIISGDNKAPGILPNNLSCGNKNYSGNTSPIVVGPSSNNFVDDFIDYSPKGFMLNYTMLFQEE